MGKNRINDGDLGPLFNYRPAEKYNPPQAPPEFDSREAAARRNASMDEVEKNARELWNLTAFYAVIEVARTKPFLTADDVQVVLSTKPVKTHDNRALGPVLVKAAKEHIIVDTGTFTRSSQVKCHRMPRRIWRSLLYDTAAGVTNNVLEFPPPVAAAK